MAREIYLNMVVGDLKKSMAFFTHLGFTFNAKFTDENAACMVISETIYCMLQTQESFGRFTKKTIIDPHQMSECIFALSATSRDEVDEMANKVLEAGGSMYRDTEDYGWMYLKSFEDLDGHMWEIAHMDESKMPAEMIAA